MGKGGRVVNTRGAPRGTNPPRKKTPVPSYPPTNSLAAVSLNYPLLRPTADSLKIMKQLRRKAMNNRVHKEQLNRNRPLRSALTQPKATSNNTPFLPHVLFNQPFPLAGGVLHGSQSCVLLFRSSITSKYRCAVGIWSYGRSYR